MGSEIEVSESATTIVMNQSDAPTGKVMKALVETLGGDVPMMAALSRWTERVQPKSRRGTIHSRDRYVTPDKTFDKIRAARDALNDDVVGGAADTTESLVFSDVSFFSGDERGDYEEQDVWNQWAGDVDLDSRLREIWRVLFTDSQCVIGAWWGADSYKVRGKTEAGNARRKKFENLRVPLALTIIDTLKVTPVGNLMFGQEDLAYIASREESDRFDAILAGREARNRGMYVVPDEGDLHDEVVERLVRRRYTPARDEEMRLRKDGVDPQYLYLLDPESVFRHTLTRPGFKRFADVRMESVLPLLDMKEQLRSKDRAFLLAGTNYLVIITKGSDKKEALPEELAALNHQMRTVASLPFIVGDHRLKVEIVTPNFEQTLNRNGYDTLDLRIYARLMQTFVPTGEGGDDPLKLGKIIAEGLESRRKMIRRFIEREIVKRMVARNPAFTSKPKLLFTPEQISLSFDQSWASFLLEMRSKREISRESLLSSFGFTQKDEAARLEREAKEYDEIFGTVEPGGAQQTAPVVPGGPNDPSTKRAAGRQGGGLKGGGGAAPGSGQGQAPRRPRKKSDGGSA